MMKIKHLYDNESLATMLVKNWFYDEESLDLFKYFRISSNAIYPFKSKGNLRFLRFAPKTEKNFSEIAAELEFIAYLKYKGYLVPETIPSKDN